MNKFLTFTTAQSARDYRHTNGTGGWIFIPDHGDVVLFPPNFYPTMIMLHPLTRGMSGKLV